MSKLANQLVMDFLIKEKGIGLEDRLDVNNNTLLLVAAREGKYDLCKALLEVDVDVNCCSDVNDTPLHWAFCNRDLALAKLLIEYGGNIHAVNRYNSTPLDFGKHTEFHAEMTAFIFDRAYLHQKNYFKKENSR